MREGDPARTARLEGTETDCGWLKRSNSSTGGTRWSSPNTRLVPAARRAEGASSSGTQGTVVGGGLGGRAAPHDKHPVRRRGACLHHPPSPPDPAWGWRQGGLWADRASFSPKDGPWVSPPDTLPPRPLGPGCSLIGPARLPHQVPPGPPWRRVSCDSIP